MVAKRSHIIIIGFSILNDSNQVWFQRVFIHFDDAVWGWWRALARIAYACFSLFRFNYVALRERFRQVQCLRKQCDENFVRYPAAITANGARIGANTTGQTNRLLWPNEQTTITYHVPFNKSNLTKLARILVKIRVLKIAEWKFRNRQNVFRLTRKFIARECVRISVLSLSIERQSAWSHRCEFETTINVRTPIVFALFTLTDRLA